MRKSFYSIVNKKDSENGEMMIYGVIGPDFWGEGNEAKQFVQDLQAMQKKHSRIDIHINSPGGSVWDGLPMFNAIKSSTSEIHTYNDGICFSMGAVLLLAGKQVHVSKNSLTMLHNVSGMAGGNSKDLRAEADLMDMHDNVLGQMIADRAGTDLADVKNKWLNFNDNFLTAQEMIDNKLADVMESYEAKNMPANARNMSMHALTAFYLEQMEEPTESMLDKITSRLKNAFNPQNDMKFPKIFNLKGVAKPTEEQLKAVKDELIAEGITGYGIYPEAEITAAAAALTENTNLKAQLEEANGKVSDLEEKRDSLKAKLEKKKAKLEELEDKFEALSNKAGATHRNPANGKDTPPEGAPDTNSVLDNLAHNKTADERLGKPKEAAPAK